jgi:hypothetical protein
MTDGITLTKSPWHVQLAGFSAAGQGAGVKIDIRMPADAVRQMIEHGVTGAVVGTNLTVELEGVVLQDGSTSLSVVEVVVSAAQLE